MVEESSDDCSDHDNTDAGEDSLELLGEFSRSIVVRGLPCDTMVENYVLDIYMENIAGIKTSSINIGGPLAVVEFPKPVGKLYCIAGNVLGD